MTQKIPPPPPLAKDNQTLNRWLLELTSILNSQGDINPDSISGLAATTAQVGANTTNITTLEGEVVTLNAEVSTLTGQVSTLQVQVTALQANPVLYSGTGAPSGALGKVGDWYGDLTGGVGARVYIKTAVSTWTAFPF